MRNFQIKNISVSLLLILSSCLSATAESNLLSTIVAEVGKEKISRAELEQRFHKTFGLEEYSFTEEERHQLLSQTLKQLVKEKLLYFAALDEGIKEDSAESTRFALVKKLNETASNSHEELSQQYMHEIFKKESSKERLVRHIMLRNNDEESKLKLMQVRLEILKGDISFIEAARQYSEAASAIRSGELGWLTANQLEADFSETAFGLKVGELSQVIESNNKLHLIIVDELREGSSNKGQKELSFKELKKQALQKAIQKQITLAQEKNKVIVYFE